LLFYILLLNSSLEQQHLYICSFILSDNFIDSPTRSLIHIWIERLTSLIVFSDIFQFVFPKGKSYIGFADSIVDISIEVVISSVLLIENRLVGLLPIMCLI
jgi:hypothetical protein